jgi:DNA-binding transcriptional LysR family regulator
MSLNPLDWERQRAFLAVLREGSLSAAARVLGVAQPTVRRRLEALEQAIGVALFTRSPSGLSPTDAARELGGHAEAMAAAADAFARAASADTDAASGTVRITASDVVGAEVLPSLLSGLRERHPGLVFELSLTNRNEDLLRHEADIAVRMVRPAQSSLIAKKLGEIEIVAAASRAYLTKAPPLRVAADLRAHRLIGFDRDESIVRGFARLGLPLARSDFALRTDDQVAYTRLVAEGAGVGFVAAYAIRQWPGVVRLLPELAIPALPCWLAVHREIRANPLVRAAYDFLARELPPALQA